MKPSDSNHFLGNDIQIFYSFLPVRSPTTDLKEWKEKFEGMISLPSEMLPKHQSF